MDAVDVRNNRLKVYAEFYQPKKPLLSGINLWIFLPAVLLMAVFLAGIFKGCAQAETINLDIIAKIESNNNPNAYNARTGATGMYQFLPIAWKDVQNSFPELKKYPFSYARKPQVARLFAERYFVLIDRYLTHFKLEKSLKNRLFCYNQGIGLTKKGIATKESIEYVKKYHKLAKGG